MKTTGYFLSCVTILAGCHFGSAFQSSLLTRPPLEQHSSYATSKLGMAGGFEWEDPRESFDQGVDNPFKNPALMKPGEDGMKIDPARLLGPRLNGSNLYLIGMMGTGGSNSTCILPWCYYAHSLFDFSLCILQVNLRWET